MKLNPNIKCRQLRKQHSSLQLKELGNEMFSKQQFGLKIEKEKLGVKSLTFLEDYKHLKTLSVYNISKDISIISQLSSLKEIALCGLKLDNLDFLKPLTNLEYVWLQRSQLKDFGTLRNLKQLKAIKLFRLPKLENINFLEDMKSLQYINLDSCSNITEFPDLQQLKHLRRVFIDTMMRLNNISKIAKAPNLDDLIVINSKELPVTCFDSFIGHKSLKKILIGIDLKTSKKYKEIEKRLPKNIQMNGFYGTDNEFFELIN